MNRNGSTPHTIHADRGGAMVSKPVSELLVDLGVLRSHSRPRTSNDNPYSESQFKTLKYMPDFPDRFGSLEAARAFCDGFFVAYNHEHRHSGIVSIQGLTWVDRQAAVLVGSQGLPVRASWMASMARRPWLHALVR